VALKPASMNRAAPPGPRFNNSRVLLHTTKALDLSVLCAALSTMRSGTPKRESSEATVIPTGPAPTIKNFGLHHVSSRMERCGHIVALRKYLQNVTSVRDLATCSPNDLSSHIEVLKNGNFDKCLKALRLLSGEGRH
jgi:hypothetical protein